MEKNKKRIGTKIAAALVAATALTCCVLGTTFAKYTSGTAGEANVQVAKWQIEGLSENSTGNKFEIDFGTTTKISPAIDGTKKNSIENTKTTVTTIQNLSEVEAVLEITTNFSEESWGAPTTGSKEEAILNAIKPMINQVFTVDITVDGAALTDANKTLAVNSNAVTIGAKLTWNTLNDGVVKYSFGSETDVELTGDQVDTYIGMYLTSVKITFNLTATQSSILPNT